MNTKKIDERFCDLSSRTMIDHLNNLHEKALLRIDEADLKIKTNKKRKDFFLFLTVLALFLFAIFSLVWGFKLVGAISFAAWGVTKINIVYWEDEKFKSCALGLCIMNHIVFVKTYH